MQPINSRSLQGLGIVWSRNDVKALKRGTMKNVTFKDLFEEELGLIFSAEAQLLKARPVLKENVFTQEFAEMLDDQATKTKLYVKGLKKALDHLGRKDLRLRSATSKVMLSEFASYAKRFPRELERRRLTGHFAVTGTSPSRSLHLYSCAPQTTWRNRNPGVLSGSCDHPRAFPPSTSLKLRHR
jgi:Domain of unknown function (DUF892)